MVKFFLLLLAFVCGNTIIAENLTMFSINLEYDVPNKQSILFAETCTLALDIKEIKVDGVSINRFEDIRCMSSIDVSYQKFTGKKGKSFYRNCNILQILRQVELMPD